MLHPYNTIISYINQIYRNDTDMYRTILYIILYYTRKCHDQTWVVPYRLWVASCFFNVGFKGIGTESFICRYWWFLEGRYRSKQPSTFLCMWQICHILMHVYAHQLCVNLYMCSCACAGYNTYTKYACHCCQSCPILIFWMLGRCTFQMPIKSPKSTTEISYNHE